MNGPSKTMGLTEFSWSFMGLTILCVSQSQFFHNAVLILQCMQGKESPKVLTSDLFVFSKGQVNLLKPECLKLAYKTL